MLSLIFRKPLLRHISFTFKQKCVTEGEEHTITLDQESAGMLKLPNLCSLEIYKANINFLLGI